MLLHPIHRLLKKRFFYQLGRGKYHPPRNKSKYKLFIYKVTGGCIYCTNPYFSLITWGVLLGFDSLDLVVLFVLHLGLNNVFIRYAENQIS